MIRRLAAALSLALSVGACGERTETTPDPAPPPPAVAATTTTAEYKATPSPTLEAIRARGYVSCGVHPGLPGFAYPDVKGAWQGFDVDICRAVAAAALGDATKVRFTVIENNDRFGALKSGRIDLLSRNTSWTLARDAGLGLDFPAVTYFDGQGFLAPRSLNLTSADELNGARICVQAETAGETNLIDYFSARGLTYTPVPVASLEEARTSLQDEKCDAFSADMSALAASRSVMNSPNSYAMLPTVISKEPLGPVVRQEDSAWADIVRWTVYALMLAEELGVNSKTAEGSLETASDPRTRRLLGLEDDYGALLGLEKDWAYQVIRQVGAYDEVFRRNIGADSALKLERGLNALWTAPKPGLLYAPPIR
jgi:general L-amino acid transport system substrate-binding protein